ncbi:hypothetical protein BKA70DRAFT_1319559 [Coprinopsis sp. MPI-PUGE-AT-0042]|nr:hypothetical protein BKA70DRAFT_1319559 [Coprinopsis sp. MPI-PUGE-AT-0042]
MSPPPIVDARGLTKCAKCGNAVAVSDRPSKGKFYGCFWVRCHGCQWHYSFYNDDGLPSVVTTRRDVPLPAVSRNTSPTAGSPPSSPPLPQQAQAPSPSNPPVSSSDGKACPTPGCRKVPNANCTNNKRCLSCCVSFSRRGAACGLHGHRTAAAKATAAAATLDALSTPLGAMPNAPAFTPHAPTTTQALGGVAGPVDAQDEARQLQHAIDESRRHHAEQHSSQTSGAPPSRQLRERSGSQSEPSASPAPAASPPPPVIHTLVPLNTKAKAKKGSVTNHLNETWSRPFEDRTGKAPPARSLRQNDPAAVKRFRLVFFSKTGDPSMTLIEDQQCPYFPSWHINDSSVAMALVGEHVLEVYDVRIKWWITCTISTAHTVSTDSYLFVREHGSPANGLDDLLATLDKRAPHYRGLISRQRDSVKTYLATATSSETRGPRSKGKEREIIPVDSDYDSDIEIIDNPSSANKRARSSSSMPSVDDKKPRFQSPSSSESSGNSPQGSRSRPSPPRTVDGAADDDNMLDFLPLTERSAALQPQQGSRSPVAIDDGSLISPIPGCTDRWPMNMYVVDVVRGFLRIKELQQAGTKDFGDRFRQAFPSETTIPKDRTYREHVQKWKQGPNMLRTAFWEAGRTSKGTWKAYSRHINLKKIRNTSP